MPQLTDAEVQQLQQRVAELELTLDNLTKSQPSTEAPTPINVDTEIKTTLQGCVEELRSAVLSGPNPTSMIRVENVIIMLSGLIK